MMAVEGEAAEGWEVEGCNQCVQEGRALQVSFRICNRYICAL